MKVMYRDFDGEYNIPSFGTIEHVKKIDVHENFINVITESGTLCRIKFEKLISIDSEEDDD